MDYTVLASQEAIDATVKALADRNVSALVVDTREQALDKIKQLIPAGASVMNGSSVTLEEIGFVDYLASKAHPWRNLHDAILAEQDPDKQKALRKQAVLSDWYLGSVHAVARTGEFVIGSNSGSQLPHIAYTSPNLLFVAGTQKIVPTLQDALARLETYVVPLEEQRMKTAYGTGTALNKQLIFRGENPKSGRKLMFLFVKERLGF